MARVKLTLSCVCCGRQFEHVHFCNNASAAASYEGWAKENVHICPECHSKHQAEGEFVKLRNYIADLGAVHRLPVINGVSEKQIAYAESLRSKFLLSLMQSGANLRRFFKLADAVRYSRLDEAGLARVRECASAAGESPEEWFAQYRVFKLRREAGLPFEDAVLKIELIFSESNAAELIDGLR